MFPEISGWDALHPLIVHFPIALLIVAPVFVILAALAPKNNRAYGVSALVLMALGTLGAVIAVSTGEAAGEIVQRTPDIARALNEHEELAETTRTLFVLLTVIYAVIVGVPILLGKKLSWVQSAALSAMFLCLYAAGTLYLVRTGEHGGQLVHHYGVQALIAPPETPPPPQGDREGAETETSELRR